ncbi:MAG: PIN domain-containing protein [Patescibacteria group bacterium]
MKDRYLVDTNVFIRMFLWDNLSQYESAVALFTEAKQGKKEILVIPEIFIEIDYVLSKVYKLPKQKIIEYLEHIMATPYVEIVERESVVEMLELYKQSSIKLVDGYLFVVAKNKDAQVFSFDRDFRKLQSN